ncbi:MAG: superoxide dismutase family protein [Balneolales bacterium]
MNIRFLSLMLLTFIFIACNQNGQGNDNAQTATAPGHDQMIAVMHPTEGNDTYGTITFTREGDDVRVQATIEGLEANGRHGFHIHQYGDCSASDGTSAGGHFTPIDMPHGAPTDQERHMGDMGNLDSDQNGVANIDYVDPVIEMSGNNSILGRGIIVHAGEDDLTTQPTGDAGGRLGCAVIGVAQP